MDRFLMNVGRFLGFLFEVFDIISTLSASNENVILIQYLLCFENIGLLKKKEKVSDVRYILEHFFE